MPYYKSNTRARAILCPIIRVDLIASRILIIYRNPKNTFRVTGLKTLKNIANKENEPSVAFSNDNLERSSLNRNLVIIEFFMSSIKYLQYTILITILTKYRVSQKKGSNF